MRALADECFELLERRSAGGAWGPLRRRRHRRGLRFGLRLRLRGRGGELGFPLGQSTVELMYAAFELLLSSRGGVVARARPGRGDRKLFLAPLEILLSRGQLAGTLRKSSLALRHLVDPGAQPLLRPRIAGDGSCRPAAQERSRGREPRNEA